MPKEGLAQNKYIIFFKQLYKTLQDYLGPKYKITVNFIFGFIIFAILCGFVWWNWDKISHLPGVNRIISWISEKPLPQADPNTFSVLVAHLENDKEKEIENLMIESLKELKGIQLLRLDRNIRVSGTNPEQAEQEGHKQARNTYKKPAPKC